MLTVVPGESSGHKGRKDGSPSLIAMVVKLIESARDRWRAVGAPRLVPLIRAGATFTHGKLAERAEVGAQRREAAA